MRLKLTTHEAWQCLSWPEKKEPCILYNLASKESRRIIVERRSLIKYDPNRIKKLMCEGENVVGRSCREQ